MRPLFLLFAAALAACERPPKPPEPAPVEVTEVAAADGFGAEGAAVAAVAFWSHPTLSFQSLVIAAGDDGLQALNIETGDAVWSGGPAGAKQVEVFYEGGAGYLLASDGVAYRAAAIDNATRALSPLAVANAAAGAGFCVGPRGGRTALYEIGAAGDVAWRAIAVAGSNLTLGAPQKVAGAGRVRFCHVDARDGGLITIAADGAIRRIDAATGEAFGLAIADGAIDSTAVVLKTREDGGGGGQIAVLDGAAGIIRVFDLADGRPIGAVKVKSTFDLDAVASAKAIAAGYGNYGAVYRDGALAVLAEGGGAPIRLVPWNGVLSALAQPLGETVDPRAPNPIVEEEDILSIEFKEP
jgi:outer membrane protein assembly factor BamB